MHVMKPRYRAANSDGDIVELREKVGRLSRAKVEVALRINLKICHSAICTTHLTTLPTPALFYIAEGAMAGTTKRRSRVSHPSKPIQKPADNEWEKEDEELELEQQLFGRSKKRVRPNGPGPGPDSAIKADETTGDLVSDDEVASEDDFGDVGPPLSAKMDAVVCPW